MNNYASGNVTSLAGRDSMLHHISTGDQAGLRQALCDLTEAIRGLDDSVPEQAVALVVAEKLADAVKGASFDTKQATSWWECLSRFVNTVSALQIATNVPALYHQVEPLMTQLLTSPPAQMLPSALT